jgi:hypothetical protein
MNKRIAIAVTAAVLSFGIAAPASAAQFGPNPNTPVSPSVPLTPNAPIGPNTPYRPGIPIPRGPFIPVFFRNANVTLPSCKEIATARIFGISAYSFDSYGDLSDPSTHTGYGTEFTRVQSIIEDGGYSCTFRVVGSKDVLVISVAPISPYDRSVVLAQYLSTFGSTPHSIGGENVYVGGTGPSWSEVSFLLEDGALVSGKVHSGGDFFPAVLQDVSDMVYELNH